ncbi:MAG: AAA family ATPase [Oscillospiraceae bacterium]
MLIKTLEMQGFGPFVEKTVIDFSQFYSKTFVIAGDTGAGKTSIFDAITFALFGTASGSGRTVETLRSRHIPKEVTAYVTLTFTHGGKEYIVHRELDMNGIARSNSYIMENNLDLKLRDFEIVRKKKNSKETDGDTKQIVEKSLNSFITELVGCKPNVFKQIYLLAQNEFTKFLNCSTAERTEILRSILHTEEYKDFEDKLSGIVKKMKIKQQELAHDYSRLLDRGITNNVDVSSFAGKKTDDDYTMAGLLFQAVADKANELTNKQAQAESDIKSEQDKADAARSALEEAKTTNEIISSLQEKSAELERLKAERPHIEGLNKSLELSAKLTFVMLKINELDSIKKKYSDCEAEIHQLENKILVLDKEHSDAVEAKSAAEKQNSCCDELRDRAQKIKDIIENYYNAAQTFKEKQQALKDLEGELPAVKAAGSEIAQRVELQEQQLASQRELAGMLGKRMTEQQTVKHRLESAVELRESMRDLETKLNAKINAESEESLAKTAYEAAEEEYRELVALYISSTAARLAKKLKVGDICPLCGSKIDCMPDFGSNAVITDEMLEEERKKVEKANQEYSKAQSAAKTSRNVLDTAISSVMQQFEMIYGFAMPEDAEKAAEIVDADIEKQNEELSRCNSAVAEAETASKNSDESEILLKSLREESEQCSKRQVELEVQIREAKAALTKSEQELESATQALPEGSVQLAQAQAEELTKDIETRQTAYQKAYDDEKAASENLSVANARIKEKKSQLEQYSLDIGKRSCEIESLLKENGFANEQEVRSGEILSEEQQNSIKAEIGKYEADMAVVSEKVKELSEKLPADACIIDTTELESVCAGHEEKIAKLYALKSETDTAVGAIKGLVEETRELEKSVKTFSERFDVMSKLYTLVAGGVGSGKPRLSLECYVLRARFDKVLECANVHYAVMSDGRYRLQSRDTISSGRSAQGLDLEVVDNTVTIEGVGKARNVCSLSGGESFEASFALAMGLSDYASNCGGVARTEMLFVDEGFSSLDTESFSRALEVIDKFSESDRMLGLVSHISEIREHYSDNRIDVVPAKVGSTVALFSDGEAVSGGV